MSLTIWMVRHGETASNADGMFQGHIDTPLNARGEAQARAVGEFLRGVVFDAVYASDLQRAARTAELIVHGRQPVILDPDLREMHYGVLQGVHYRDAELTLRSHGMADDWASGAFHRRGLAPPGGESIRTLRSRSRRFQSMLGHAHGEGDQSVLVVAHGGKLAMLLTVLLGLPGQARHLFRLANCGLTRVSRFDDRATLDFHNLVVWDERWPIMSPGTRGPLHPRGE
ncbi:MAG TPA: histidine phosphatase family protein [Thermomicrobiales bacterium]|nr:histidine phosphatase family protein [Thermomicrobiales bacterium]